MKLYVVRKDGRYARSMFGEFGMQTKPRVGECATYMYLYAAEYVAERLNAEVIEVKRGKGAELEVVS